MNDLDIKYYNKALVAKHFPANKCFVENGKILIVNPSKLESKNGNKKHHFSDYQNEKINSQYGWVTTIDPMTLDQFVDIYLGKTNNLRQIEHNRVMLNSIQKLADDTPVAATYSERGLEQKRVDFTVHKVFFYK